MGPVGRAHTNLRVHSNPSNGASSSATGHTYIRRRGAALGPRGKQPLLRAWQDLPHMQGGHMQGHTQGLHPLLRPGRHASDAYHLASSQGVSTIMMCTLISTCACKEPAGGGWNGEAAGEGVWLSHITSLRHMPRQACVWPAADPL